MRVALDAGPLLDPPTGIGRYTRNLASSLEARGVDVVRYAVAMGGAGEPNIKRLRVPARVAQTAWRTTGRPSLEGLVGHVDVFHGTNFVLPPLGGAKGVVTVHDLSFFSDDAFPGAKRLQKLVPWSVARAAVVIVPSRAVGDEVEARLEVPGERIVVTHEGVAPVFFTAPRMADTLLEGMGIPGRFALAVGALAPRKNIGRLVDAWARAAVPDWTLVLAGPSGWGPDLPETPGVRLVGWVSDELLPSLFAAADLFCYPSTYEGFGLPPLEAMAAGTPAVVGRYPAATEILGEAAVFVDPLDVDGLAGEIARLASDEALRSRLSRAGRAHAAGFTWERTAEATMGAYDQAVMTPFP
jgi:glycosyltransferase involved in cell wall biosynthesis